MIVGVPVQVPVVAERVCPSRAVPEITGATVLTGAVGATTAVTAENADALPPPFVPVTRERSVPPTSAATAVYVEAVASGMSVHEAPAALQRCHWYVKVIVGEPVQVPFVVVRTWPSRAVPETTGMTVLTGGAAVTRAVTAENADALPPPFVPVTRERSVPPTSAATAVYVEAVASGMSVHEAPAALQRCHWYVKVIVGEPVQVPFVVVRTWPSRAVPETTGMTVLTGATAVMTALWVVVDAVEPPAFVAVTTPRIVLPTSAAVSV